MRRSTSLVALLLIITTFVRAQVRTVARYIEQIQALSNRAGMGFDPPITNAGSNNSSAALLAGISSISTGAGPCDGSHSLAENCEIEPLYEGIKKILLLEVALAGVQREISLAPR